MPVIVAFSYREIHVMFVLNAVEILVIALNVLQWKVTALADYALNSQNVFFFSFLNFAGDQRKLVHWNYQRNKLFPVFPALVQLKIIFMMDVLA